MSQMPNQQQPVPIASPPKKDNTLLYVGIGCGSLVVLAGIVVLISVIVLVNNVKQIAATFASDMVAAQIQNSQLPQDQKDVITAQVDRLSDAFANGQITEQQVQTIIEGVVQSPIIPVGMLHVVRSSYIAPSELTDDEKKEADMTLQRFVRGIVEQKISPVVIEGVLDPITDTNPNTGERVLMSNPSVGELREFIEAAKEHADDAAMPNEPYEVDMGAEVKKLVDDALGEESE